MLVEEWRYNIMESYKKFWNNHVPGEDCWCKPMRSLINRDTGEERLVHRNYVWSEDGTRYGQWVAIKENRD